MTFNKLLTALYISCFLFTMLTFHSTALAEIKGCQNDNAHKNTFYVSSLATKYKGKGTRSNPWNSIEEAAYQVPDNSLIIVSPGVYTGQVKLNKNFSQGLTIRSEIDYQAKLTNDRRVVAFVSEASNITLEGFEIYHNSKKPKPLIVHIDGGGSDKVNNITLRNNIIHDSYNNDLLKINNGAVKIKVLCNMFYNQGNSDEHIDINSVSNVEVRNNIFFNDFTASNRKISNKSSSFITIKDSNGKDDNELGAHNIHVNSNIFLNWQGSHGNGFVLIGEDGKNYYEAFNVKIYNNLMIGNSDISMRSPFGVKGAKNVWFYNNTITGDLPSNAFAIRVNKEGKNKTNTQLYFYNNIWSDPTGTMGMGDDESYADFSDTMLHEIDDFILENNLIWNGGKELPTSFFDAINPSDDKYLLTFNPNIPNTQTLIPPIWIEEKKEFKDNSFTISEAFQRLVYFYGTTNLPIKAQGFSNNPYYPQYNILGRKRENKNSVGAL